MRGRLFIDKPVDRDAAAVILIRNGYTVRIGREKCGSRYLYFVEYWKEGEM